MCNSLYSVALKRKKHAFKNNNVGLYKFLMLFYIFIGPIFLIFARLPGYLLIHNNGHAISLILALVFFIFLALLESFLYWFFWSRQELLYFISIKGKFLLLREHWRCFFKRSLFFHLFVFAVFFKINFSLNSIIYIFFCYSIILAMFILTYEIKMIPFGSNKRIEMPSFTAGIKLISLLFANGVKTRLLLIALILVFSFFLKLNNKNVEALRYFSLIFSFTSLYLLSSIFNLMLKNIDLYKNYFNSIDKSLYAYQKKCVYFFCIVFFILNLIFIFK